jgi:2-polyprenyl-3-methyl-5-hydroxy-6-metoxy-1,4-benzoquinol methylase
LDSLGMYYPDDYGPYKKQLNVNGEKSSSILAKAKTNKLLSRVFSTFQNFGYWIPPLPPGATALDIGCANGDFLLGLAERNWSLYGVELAEEPAAFARDVLGLNVYTGTLEDADFPDGFFDVIFAFMVVEHLTDPLVTLREVKRTLKHGGYFVISVPNAGSWQLKVFRGAWRPLEVPRHMSHFTPKTIHLLMEKSGLSLEKIIFQRTVSDIIVTIGYWLRNSGVKPNFGQKLINFPKTRGLLTRFLLLPFEWLQAVARQSSRMTVISRKY